MADAHLSVSADQGFGDFRRDTALQEEAAGGGAALSGRADGAEQARRAAPGRDSASSITMMPLLPPSSRIERPRRRAITSGHVAAYFGGPGEADQRNARVVNQALGHRPARSDDQIEDTLQTVPVEARG